MALKLLLCVLCGQFLTLGCAEKDPDLTIRFLCSESYTFPRADRRAIEDGARAAIAEVRRLLPGVPAHIELTVRPGTDVILETGETGDAMPPNGLMLTLDPSRPGDASRKEWLFDHPDGRRWIGYKVGTYWVDQIKSKTGKSAADLVGVPTSEILSMASP